MNEGIIIYFDLRSTVSKKKTDGENFKIFFFLDSSWVIIGGDAKMFLLKNDSGAFYRASKFDFLKILEKFFFWKFFFEIV